MTEQDLRDAIQAARAQHRVGAGAVLDILMRAAGPAGSQMVSQLQERGGIAVLTSVSGVTPDFSQWDATLARSTSRQRCRPR